MSSDAAYLIDMFTIQYEMFKKSMLDRGLRWDKFDRYSYSATAIEMLLEDLKAAEDTSYVDVSLIRQIIRLHIEMYESYIHKQRGNSKRFEYALKSVNYLYSLTGGYLNE